MKRLILHCGYTKTGTSAIQYGLGLNHKLLLDHSINYPLSEDLQRKITEGISVVGNAKSLVDFGKQLKLNKNLEKSRQKLIELLEKCKSTDSNLTILSSEAIAGSFDNYSILVLKDLLYRYFEHVRILYYVRDILDHSVSQYNEYVKRRKAIKTFNEYASTHKCNFKQHIETLFTGFGENLEVINYSDVKNDLWVNFIKNLKFQNLDHNNLKSPKRINRSLCNEEIDFYRLLKEKSKITLVRHLLEFWENTKPLSKREIIPSLKVLNLFEKKYINQLEYVNQFLKDSSSPLKVVSKNLEEKIKTNSSNKNYKSKKDQYFINKGVWIYKANQKFMQIRGKKDHNFQVGDLIVINFKSEINELFSDQENTQKYLEVDKVLSPKKFKVRIKNNSLSNLEGECEYIKYEYSYFIDLCDFLLKRIENTGRGKIAKRKNIKI